MNLKESQEYMGRFWEGKGREKRYYYITMSKIKDIIKSKTKQRFKVKAVLVMQKEATV